MGRKFIRASVVMLAKAHNPSILSPDWLKRNEVITEKPIQFALTPDFAIFDSKNINLIVDRQRYQLNIKGTTKKSLDKLVQITTKYLELLPHIPYIKLGMNFEWIIEDDDEGSAPIMKPAIGTMNDFSSVFPEHELCFGTIIIAHKEPYILRVNIEPTIDDKTITYKFNFDYKLKDLAVEKIIEYVESIHELQKFATGIVLKTTE